MKQRKENFAKKAAVSKLGRSIRRACQALIVVRSAESSGKGTTEAIGKGTNLPLPPKLVEGLRPAKQYFYWMNLIVAKIQAYLLY